MDPTIQQVATQLGLTVLQVITLMANPAFPAPSSGNGLSASWAAGPINAFASTWASVLANGWRAPTSIMGTAPLVLWASTTPGKYYGGAAGVPGADQLWDDFP